MTAPKTIKEVQSLTGKVAALTRFLSKAAERQLPFFKTLKGCLKQKSFVWSSEAETAFQEMKKLRRYFQGHPVHVLTNMPIKQVLTKPEISGRLALWAMELGTYQISYLSHSAVKGQVMADYLAEMSGESEVINERTALKLVLDETWDLFTYGASCAEGAGAGLVLANPSGEEHTYALCFNFDVSNNEAEYEALLAGLNIARKMNIAKLRAFTDSQLIENYFNGSFEAHDPSMQKYLQLLKELTVQFEHFELEQMPSSQNKKANALSKLAALTFGIPRELVSNNGAQIAKDPFKTWCADLNIIQKFTSVAHPQANGLYEVTNRDIVSDELPNVLWAHRTTFKKSTGETPFSLVYGSEAVIPAKILVPTHRIVNFEEEANDAALSENLNFIGEQRLMAAIRESNNKQQIAKYYNKRVCALYFAIVTLSIGISAKLSCAVAAALRASASEQTRSPMAGGSGSGMVQCGAISSRNFTLSHSRKAAA
ncbi:uncharacterized protein [Rutidosis leptorrhynchoides]|uniref:uncharacterized protein n=1 Tax=Rutidosis leptorrhynchoides TaxID=125765 RepID=UPI003A994892